MLTLQVLFLIVALVLFILSAGNVPGGRINLLAAGAAFAVAAFLVPMLR